MKVEKEEKKSVEQSIKNAEERYIQALEKKERLEARISEINDRFNFNPDEKVWSYLEVPEGVNPNGFYRSRGPYSSKQMLELIETKELKINPESPIQFRNYGFGRIRELYPDIELAFTTNPPPAHAKPIMNGKSAIIGWNIGLKYELLYAIQEVDSAKENLDRLIENLDRLKHKKEENERMLTANLADLAPTVDEKGRIIEYDDDNPLTVQDYLSLGIEQDLTKQK